MEFILLFRSIESRYIMYTGEKKVSISSMKTKIKKKPNLLIRRKQKTINEEGFKLNSY